MADKQKEMQEKYMELQLLDQQIKENQKQAQLLEQQMLELNLVKQNLDEIKDVKAGTEILAPLSSGIFAKADLKKSDELLVNVGANVVVEKDVDSTKKLIDKQLEEMNRVYAQMNQEVQKLAIKAGALQDKLAGLVEE